MRIGANALAQGAVKLALGLVLLASMATAYFFTSTLWPKPKTRLTSFDIKTNESTEPPVNPFASADGKNLVIYFFTASDCGWSQIAAQAEDTDAMVAKIRAKYTRAYAKITVIAVDIDEDVDAGYKYLKELGGGSIAPTFDQMIVGGSWLNNEIVRLVWREKTVESAIPQIVIVERMVSSASWLDTAKLSVQDDRIIHIIRGAALIERWIKQGYPLTDRSAPVAVP